ncbi:MAG: Bac transf protein, partial [Patescibacteria group bacterium]|nr:Bac transf protein [Patescibacteria group bacterium]
MKKGLLLLGDIIILYLSLALTLWLRYGYLDQNLWNRHLLPFSIIFALWLVIFYINGLYEFKKVRTDFSFYANILQNITINSALAV